MIAINRNYRDFNCEEDCIEDYSRDSEIKEKELFEEFVKIENRDKKRRKMFNKGIVLSSVGLVLLSLGSFVQYCRCSNHEVLEKPAVVRYEELQQSRYILENTPREDIKVNDNNLEEICKEIRALEDNPDVIKIKDVRKKKLIYGFGFFGLAILSELTYSFGGNLFKHFNNVLSGCEENKAIESIYGNDSDYPY